MRKLLIIIGILLTSASLSWGQWTNESEIKDFSKLLTSHINPFLTPNNGAVVAQNVRANELYGALVKRASMIDAGSAGSFKITGLHRYYQADGDKYTIASGSSVLVADKNDSGTYVTIRDELTDGARWQFLTYKDKVIGGNGVDRPQKYDGATLTTANTDGARTAGILTADLGAPFAELNTGTALDASKWYQYKVAFYDGSTYFFSNARSNPILTGADVHNITLTDIPLGPSGTTARYIYRTLDNASRAAAEANSTFYLVGTISDNSTTTYNDATSDATAFTNPAPTWLTVSAGSDLTPPIGKFYELHKERLWIANNPNHKSDVYYSYAFKPDIFNAAAYEPIRENDGDEITFLKNQLGVLVIGKTNTIMKFNTLAASDTQWQVVGPYSTVGCQAPYSASQSPLGIIYLSKNGIYVFNGEGSQLISDVVTKDLKDALWTSRNDVAGIYFDNEYYLSYTSKESGEGENNRVMVFDLQRDSYNIDLKNLNAFAVFSSGTDDGTLYAGSSLSDGHILGQSKSSSEIVYKTKSALEAGTMDSVDITGTEDSPVIELAWGIGCDDASLAGLTTNDFTTEITDRPETSGEWFSPILNVQAGEFDKLYWSEELGGHGEITFDVRTGSSEAAVNAAAFSGAYTDPSGSDISGVSAADYIQLRANLSTDDIVYSPYIVKSDNFNIRLVYNKEGGEAETSIPAIWKSGLLDLGVPQRKKRIWEILVYYSGTAGTLTFDVGDVDNNVTRSFPIDLSLNPETAGEETYSGTNDMKVKTYRFPMDGNAPIAEYFQYTLSESGSSSWTVYKIKTRFTVEDVY